MGLWGCRVRGLWSLAGYGAVGLWGYRTMESCRLWGCRIVGLWSHVGYGAVGLWGYRAAEPCTLREFGSMRLQVIQRFQEPSKLDSVMDRRF